MKMDTGPDHPGRPSFMSPDRSVRLNAVLSWEQFGEESTLGFGYRVVYGRHECLSPFWGRCTFRCLFLSGENAQAFKLWVKDYPA